MSAPMLRAISLLATLAMLLLPTSAAGDGVYFSESGGATSVKGELDHGTAGRVRFAGGYRYKSWAFELHFGADIGLDGGDLRPVPPPNTPGGPGKCRINCNSQPEYEYEHVSMLALVSYGADVKYLRPVSKNFELYLRGGFSHAFLDGANDYSGRGLGIGAGAQLKGKVPAVGFLFWPLFFTNWGPKITAAAFIDQGFDYYRLHKGGRDGAGSIDASLSRLTVGIAFGADF